MNTPPNAGMVLFVADLALLLAAAMAIVVARRWPRHWPIAAYLGALVLADWARRGLAVGPLSGAGPYTGLARAAFHVEEALYLIGPFGLAALAVAVLAQRVPWGVAGAYVAAVAALALGYPGVRGEMLRRCYVGAELGAVVVALAAAAAWARRRERVDLTSLVLFFVFVVDVAKLLGGPFRGDLFTSWVLAWPMHAVLYGVIAGVQGGAWWVLRQR